MSKEPTILEEMLPAVRELYAPTYNYCIAKIPQKIAVGMISGMIYMQKAAEQAHKKIQEMTKSNGR